MGEAVQVEIERKYDVDGQASLPRLNGVGGVAQVRYCPPMALEAIYFDTAERDLSANNVTLRRRTGGTDAGWHVKIGKGERRLELHSPLGKDDAADISAGPITVSVPARILDLVQVHVRGKQLVPIARLNTLRSVVDLLDGQGRRLAEVSDDQVAAMAVGFRTESRVQHWREWEVEVVDAGLVAASAGGTDAFLDAVGQVLQPAGARPSAVGSKVEKVVGKAVDPLDPRAPLAGAATTEDHDGGAPAVRAVLATTVRTQLKILKGWDPLVRRDVEDSVHQYRVACRALRSLLQTYAPLLEAEATETVIRDLRKLGKLLSVARDAEVVRDQVQVKVDALPGGPQGAIAEMIPGKTVKRLRAVKAERYEAAHAQQVKRMRSSWYFEVLDRLDAFALTLPLNPELPEGDTAAAAAMVPLATAQVDSVLALAAGVGSEQDQVRRIDLMHEVRKEAKRLRYAVKAVQDATGVDLGAELVARMKTAKKLQEALGEHRDSVMFQEHVLSTSELAARKGEDTFGYGLLFAAEFALQASTEAAAERLVEKLAHRHAGDVGTAAGGASGA
ncbi:CYTH and CHAD domain-containing protein [Citricoccus sp. K5]|uniref:CYTH and CHAD domain-containing protein n=1 Tax=Citricoccus sp. K5 TaxID=2653135 RepID=UPI0012EF78B7|nr:CYTH and CHAD domain-containing protein [Citricoccus sp. K5]VXB00684.1 CHAD domain-containing protein [Citricoccus sp. K5]